MVGVPFERPAELAGRDEVTDEEFAAARRTGRGDRPSADGEEWSSTAPARRGDGTGPPSHWLERGKPSRRRRSSSSPPTAGCRR